MKLVSRGYLLQILGAFLSLVPTSSAQITVTAIPSPPTTEFRDRQQIANFDLLVANATPTDYQLVSIQLSVFDLANRLVLRRELNENGHPPAIDIVGDRLLHAHGTEDVFQPFPTFDESIPLHRMHFDLLFMRTGRPVPPVPLTADEVVAIDVLPQPPAASAPYCLPTRGLTLVHDGHDLFSHHRRFDLAARFAKQPSSAVNPNLYAYDLMLTDNQGHLYRGNPAVKQNWLSYNQPIFAPADGVVLEAVNNVPENTFDGPNAVSPPNSSHIDPLGLGNHVLLRHDDGRVSWLLHMRPGSVAVNVGEQVHAGQMLGRIGFSGDALFPHLHYNVTSGRDYPSQGVPSYFHSFFRRLGSSTETVTIGHAEQIDSGDLVESTGACLIPFQ